MTENVALLIVLVFIAALFAFQLFSPFEDGKTWTITGVALAVFCVLYFGTLIWQRPS